MLTGRFMPPTVPMLPPPDASSSVEFILRTLASSEAQQPYTAQVPSGHNIQNVLIAGFACALLKTVLNRFIGP